MMADFAAIFSTVSRGSTLALDLYKVAATRSDITYHLNRIARSISSLSFTVKQVGTIIREDDTLPSAEAVECLEDILDQCNSALTEIECIETIENARRDAELSRFQSSDVQPLSLSEPDLSSLDYLQAHLDALQVTLAVMMQTLYTAQSIKWARDRPTISPQQAASAVANEKMQLENLIIEQQLALLAASKIFNQSRPDTRLLMDKESSQSIVARESGSPQPTALYPYQNHFLASLDTSEGSKDDWLPAVCGISTPRIEHLLESWTRLRQFRETMQDAQRDQEAKRRESQQPTVESESEEEVGSLPKFTSNRAVLSTPKPRRPASVEPLLTENYTLPIAVPDTKFGPTAPLSPASSYGASPRSSFHSLSSKQITYAPVSPRSSISSLPVEAAAAIESKSKEDDLELGIPWKLFTPKCYWEFLDGKVIGSDTHSTPLDALTDRNSWTEISASWVCKEAIEEANYKHTQVQKDQPGNRRTKFETYFYIQHPLKFEEVKKLVERTVELYRQNRPPSPAPHQRRPSTADRPSVSNALQAVRDRDRTPLANQVPQVPPLERSTTTHQFPPPPPRLDRSHSLPGPVPNFAPNPHATTLHLPMLSGQPYPQQAAKPPYSPQMSPFSSYPSPQSPLSPQTFHPPQFNPAFNHAHPEHRRSLPSYPQSPLRQSVPQTQPRQGYYSSTSTTSDSDNTPRSARSDRSRSRRPSSNMKRRKSRNSMTALAKVGGLAALLDGIVEMGVL